MNIMKYGKRNPKEDDPCKPMSKDPSKRLKITYHTARERERKGKGREKISSSNQITTDIFHAKTKRGQK